MVSEEKSKIGKLTTDGRRTTDGRTTDDGQRMITIVHLSLRLRCTKKSPDYDVLQRNDIPLKWSFYVDMHVLRLYLLIIFHGKSQF